MWKGDRVAACVAAASVLAKVTRDRMMLELHERWPEYDFAGHKGYITDVHTAALDRHGPCPEHRMRFVNVARARDAHAARALHAPRQRRWSMMGAWRGAGRAPRRAAGHASAGERAR